jgi:hypothetical protein
MTSLLLIAIFILILGATLAAVALRVKRIDTHPICHQRGFDLHGLAAAALPATHPATL